MDKRTMVFMASLVSTIAETGEAPDGVCYAGLMTAGCSYDEYANIRGALVSNGLVTLSGDVLRITPAGKVLATRLDDLLRKG